MTGPRASVLVLTVLAAGCAATPIPDSAASFAATEGAEFAIAEPVVEVVTERELRAASDKEIADAEIVCRDMLQQASNALITRCMTRQDWRTYQRAQELWAQQMLRQMQGSPYR